MASGASYVSVTAKIGIVNERVFGLQFCALQPVNAGNACAMYDAAPEHRDPAEAARGSALAFADVSVSDDLFDFVGPVAARAVDSVRQSFSTFQNTIESGTFSIFLRLVRIADGVFHTPHGM